MATRGRWPQLIIEFLDGHTVEYIFDNPASNWEPTGWDLIVTESEGIRHAYPRCNIRSYSVINADYDHTACNAAIQANTEHALDWSNAVDEFRATARRETFET